MFLGIQTDLCICFYLFVNLNLCREGRWKKEIIDMQEEKEIDDIKKRMAELEVLINETKARLPAHSVKPPVMMDLLDYEDEFDELLAKLNALKNK